MAISLDYLESYILNFVAFDGCEVLLLNSFFIWLDLAISTISKLFDRILYNFVGGIFRISLLRGFSESLFPLVEIYFLFLSMKFPGYVC